jgi:hypothetical protein
MSKKVKGLAEVSGNTFATVTRSGLISYFSHPNIDPSLPNAQIT